MTGVLPRLVVYIGVYICSMVFFHWWCGGVFVAECPRCGELAVWVAGLQPASRLCRCECHGGVG
jgi:hypothetical protein